MVFENAFVAQNTMRKLVERMQEEDGEIQTALPEPRDDIFTAKPRVPRDTLKLSDNIAEAISMMERIDELTKTFKGLDCGSCGSPTCRTLAEDIVLGYAKEVDCVFKLKEKVEQLARQMVDLTNL